MFAQFLQKVIERQLLSPQESKNKSFADVEVNIVLILTFKGVKYVIFESSVFIILPKNIWICNYSVFWDKPQLISSIW